MSNVRTIAVIVSMLGAACARNETRSETISLQVVSADRSSVVMSVRNDLRTDIVLLNPAQPGRSVVEAQCRLYLSTTVDDRIRPYAFTPTLETVKAGASLQFRAVLDPLTLSAACSRWTIDAQYAYVLPEDAIFDPADSEAFRQHVLLTQKVIRTTTAVTLFYPPAPITTNAAQ